MRRALLSLTIAGSLALAACGGDGDDAAATTAAAAASTTTAATTTTEATTTTKAAAATTTTTMTGAAASTTTAAASGGLTPGADPDADVAALAWTTVFDSSLTYDAKAAYIADAEALTATIDAYTQAGQAVGGITLVPTAVAVSGDSGDSAAIIYDVKFAGQPAYQGQEGTLAKAGDTWQVSREEFCGFMAAARNPCPAG